MAKFEDIQNLDLEKIKQQPLKEAIKALLSDYEDEDNKALFVKTAQVAIDKLYHLVEVNSPEAISKPDDGGVGSETIDERNEDDSKVKEIHARKAKSRKAMEGLDEISKEIEGCREVMREYNRKKREGKEPVKKTRLTKLKDKLLGIVSLIPEKLREDNGVTNKTERILLRTLNDLKKAWGMNKIKKAEDAIKEKFDQLDQKQQRA